MLATLIPDAAFYVYWMLMNSLIYYAEFDFLLQFTEKKGKKYLPFYVALNALLTVAAISTRMFHLFSFLHVAMFFICGAVFLKLRPKDAVTPAVIIFTLSTFLEGFETVFLRFLSLTLNSQAWGLFFQLALPAGLAGLVFLTLRFLGKRYPLTNGFGIFSYLYILLLPCALMIWGIRTSLGLNSDAGQFSHGALINGELLSVLYATLWLVGTLLVFFVMIEVFHKVSVLSQRELEKALLASQVKEQRCYIEEARQRNESYRSFQHDINNHLLVLSGLLHAGKYEQAAGYLQKLDTAAAGLSAEISTGNTVLDVLLWEKIRCARQYGISISCDIRIPKESTVDNIDLCILFSNGMDNAIHACMNAAPKYKNIALTARPKYDFLLIEIVNGMDGCYAPVVYGTGLKNVKLTAEKYAGAMHLEQEENKFSLSILICLNQLSEKEVRSESAPLTQ